MALLPGELQRVRFELGFNVLSVGAEPYISYVAVFDKVIQVYLNSGAKTTSATTVTASPSGATPVTLTLTDPTGFTSGDQVVIDVDDRQEIAASSLSGSLLTVALSKPHSGIYAVTVESGEGIVRECLIRIREVKAKMAQAWGSGSLKKVDEVEFYDTNHRTQFGVLGSQLMFWRNELASALGMPNMWADRQGGMQTTVGY